jgi:hypothetical protein
VLKSKLAKKKGFTYEELCENIENVLKEIPQKTYQNLIWGCYFKPYKIKCVIRNENCLKIK